MMNKLSLFLILFLCSFTVSAQNDRPVIKILAIGNSFSVDAVESYLSDLAIAADIPVRIGSLFIGGCSLETHWNCAKGDLAEYKYCKINERGERITRNRVRLLRALMEEDWDYICFQQVSSLSGIYDSFFPYLENLLAFVKSNVQSLDTKYVLHMTWAYEATSNHPGFSNYQNNQAVMYEAIKTTYSQIAQAMDFDCIIPSGVAIQQVRQETSKSVCIDGYHLNKGIGRYTASCAWFEALLGQSVLGNSFYPKGEMTAVEAHIAQRAAQQAVLETNMSLVLRR